MTNLNSDQADEVFDAAAGYLAVADYDALYQLLQPLSDASAVGPPHLGKLYYYLGEACLGLNSLDAAMQYYEAAAPVANADLAQKVRARIAEIGRRDAAESAAVDGIEGEGEAASALRTGADLLARDEFDAARQWFQYAWDGVQMTEVQVGAAAIGLAKCELNDGKLDEAEGYLRVAEQHDATLATQVADLQRHIAYRRGGGVADDGVTAGEVHQILAAGVAAYRDRDFNTARGLFLQVLESDGVPATDRGRVWLNLAGTEAYLHDYDASRAAAQEALAAGTSAVQAKAQRLITNLDENDAGEAVVASLELDAD